MLKSNRGNRGRYYSPQNVDGIMFLAVQEGCDYRNPLQDVRIHRGMGGTFPFHLQNSRDEFIGDDVVIWSSGFQ